MLAEQGLVHVVGCYTSSSRKEVLPLFEKHDGLLWYPSHYEGFESSDNVVYTGAAPNQHIVPLAEHLLRRYGTSAYCLGSNYIWAWENNKIMREAVQSAGGAVLAERYVPVGELDFDGIIREILDCRPSFIFNTLIGDSAYTFFRPFGARGRARNRPAPHHAGRELQPRRARTGRIGARSRRRPFELKRLLRKHRHARQPNFIQAYRARSRTGPDISRCRSLLPRGATAGARRPACRHCRDTAVGGPCHTCTSSATGAGAISIATIATATSLLELGSRPLSSAFEVIYEAPAPVKPDPYLVWQDVRIESRPQRRPNLRLVAAWAGRSTTFVVGTRWSSYRPTKTGGSRGHARQARPQRDCRSTPGERADTPDR